MPETFALNLPDTIQTERLFLRAPNIKDATALQQLANNRSVHEVLARLPFPYTINHALDFISNLARTQNEHAYAITTDTGKLIGITSWHLDYTPGPELGYWLGQPYWGKGYATEVAIAMVSAASRAGYEKLFARSITANQGSLNVLKKAGFNISAAGVDDCGIHKDIHVTIFQWEKDDG